MQLLLLLYRPPFSDKHPVTTSTFLNEFSSYLEEIILSRELLMIVGDFNLHVDDRDNFDVSLLLDFIGVNELGSTCEWRHAWERPHPRLVITRETDSVLLGSPKIGHFISDHAVVNCSLNSVKPSLSKKSVTYRKIKDINITAFKLSSYRQASLTLVQ